MTYYDPAAAARPAPQLTRADLAAMKPEQVVAADDAGQFAVLKSQGRDPLPFEAKGERWATPAETLAAHKAEAEAEAAAKATTRNRVLAQLKEN